mmetsp:Transcript_24196/g.21292  ORF Transcript_24196/g.21292 Transcript_24196/m.21292 type:complete len:126 (+) Transcript_24196:1387-1764(+)
MYVIEATYDSANDAVKFDMPAGVTFNAGETVDFTISEISEVGDHYGIQLKDNSNGLIQVTFEHKATEASGTIIDQGVISNLYVNGGATVTTTFETMTQAEGNLNVWKFTFNSIAAIDEIVIEFPL